MTITFADPQHQNAGIIALNVRAFRGIDYDKLKILYADMKDEPPLYDPDAKKSS